MLERTARFAAPAALALFAVIGAALSTQPTSLAVAAALVAAVLGVALSLRPTRGWPLVAGLVMVAGSLALVCHAAPANLGWFGICVVAAWCALLGTTAQTATLTSALVVLLLTEVLLLSDEPGWGAWIAGTVFTAVLCSLARRQRELLEQLEAAQAGLADRSRAEERNRIAREMHDVIGHALTVSLLHVSSARLALDEDPDDARASLEEAERLARTSLEEVRATVGLMRSPTTQVAPMPGTADLEELLDSFRRAGTNVSSQTVGDPSRLPRTTGLAVYRIVQESLTNVARHAPGSTTAITLEVAEATRVVVDSSGPPGRRTSDGAGLVGMRERAETVGGHLSAGPFDGGWRVEAVLPS